MINKFIFPMTQTPRETPKKRYVVILTTYSYAHKEMRTYQLEYDEYNEAVKQMKEWAQSQAEHLCLIDTSNVVGLFSNENGNLTCWRQLFLTSYDM